MSTLVEIRKARTQTATRTATDVNIEDLMRRAESKQTRGVVAVRDPSTPPPKPKRLQQVVNATKRATSGEQATKYKAAAAAASKNPKVRRAAAGAAVGGLAALSIAAGRKAPAGFKAPVAGTIAGAGLTSAAVAMARKKLANMSTKQKVVAGGITAGAAGLGAAKVAHDIWRARTATGGGGGGRGGRTAQGSGGGGGGGGKAGAGGAALSRLRSRHGASLPMTARRLSPEQAAAVRRGGRYAAIGAGTGMSGAYLDRVATRRDR